MFVRPWLDPALPGVASRKAPGLYLCVFGLLAFRADADETEQSGRSMSGEVGPNDWAEATAANAGGTRRPPVARK